MIRSIFGHDEPDEAGERMATGVERSAASAASSSAGRGASWIEAVRRLATASNLVHLATVAGYCSLNITLNKCAAYF